MQGELVGHTNLVTDIRAYNGRIWSCSADANILVWEIDVGDSLFFGTVCPVT